MPAVEQTKERTRNEELLLELVRAYAKYPDDVEVSSRPITGGELMELRVNRDDHPKVWGKRGMQMAALGTLFKFIGARDKQNVRIVLLEPQVGEQRAYGYEGEGTYDRAAIEALVRKVFSRILAEPFEVLAYEAEEKVKVEIMPDKVEEKLLTEIIQYTGVVFHAVGWHQGRDLYIEVQPVIEIT